jgi:hypothetical protein
MKNDDLIITDSVLDLGDVGAAYETITLDSSSVDTITVRGSDYFSMSDTITLPSTSYNINSGLGVGSISAGTQWATGTGGYTFTNSFPPPTVNINEDGIDIKDSGDIKIGEVSLKEFMKKMEQRLAILIPDPAKLEKFQALKKAYEHYKTMESLCFDEPAESK